MTCYDGARPQLKGLMLLLVVEVAFSLDEDCNPGRGDCGRPLRLFGNVEDGDKMIYFVFWRLGYRLDK